MSYLRLPKEDFCLFDVSLIHPYNKLSIRGYTVEREGKNVCTCGRLNTRMVVVKESGIKELAQCRSKFTIDQVPLT